MTTSERATLPSISLAWALARGSRAPWDGIRDSGALHRDSKHYLATFPRLLLPMLLPGVLATLLVPAVVRDVAFLLLAHWTLMLARVGLLVLTLLLTGSWAARRHPSLPQGLLWWSSAPLWAVWPLASAPQLQLLFVPALLATVLALWQGTRVVEDLPTDERLVTLLRLLLMGLGCYVILHAVLSPLLYALVRVVPLP